MIVAVLIVPPFNASGKIQEHQEPGVGLPVTVFVKRGAESVRRFPYFHFTTERFLRKSIVTVSYYRKEVKEL